MRFAILYMLVVFHFIADLPGMAELKSFLTYALPGFFSLSGYLIHTQLVTEGFSLRKVVSFYYRRALRIMPAYYLVLVIASLAYNIEYLGWMWAYLLNIRLFFASLNGEIIRYMDHWKENGIHYWSMGIEEQFYLVYPWFLWLAGEKRRVLWLGLLITFSILVREWCIINLPQSYYGALFPVSGEYILWGALVAELNRRGLCPRFRWDYVVWPLACGAVIIKWGLVTEIAEITQFRPTHGLTVIAATMALSINSFNRSVKKSAFLSPFIYIGRMSYGVYLVHVFLIGPFRARLDPFELPLAVETTLFCLMVTLAGVLIWEFMDSPLQKFRNKFNGKGE